MEVAVWAKAVSIGTFLFIGGVGWGEVWDDSELQESVTDYLLLLGVFHGFGGCRSATWVASGGYIGERFSLCRDLFLFILNPIFTLTLPETATTGVVGSGFGQKWVIV